jgi:hypothetical protein
MELSWQRQPSTGCLTKIKRYVLVSAFTSAFTQSPYMEAILTWPCTISTNLPAHLGVPLVFKHTLCLLPRPLPPRRDDRNSRPREATTTSRYSLLQNAFFDACGPRTSSIRDMDVNIRLHNLTDLRLFHRIGGLVVKLAVAMRDHRSQCRPAPGSIPGRCISFAFYCLHGFSRCHNVFRLSSSFGQGATRAGICEVSGGTGVLVYLPRLLVVRAVSNFRRRFTRHRQLQTSFGYEGLLALQAILAGET